METERHEIGMIGLGLMGRNMLLNMADHSFPVAGYDSRPVDSLIADSAYHWRGERLPSPTVIRAWGLWSRSLIL